MSKPINSQRDQQRQEPPTKDIVDWAEYLRKAKYDFYARLSGQVSKQDPKVQLSEFDFRKTLGQGAYGRVMLIERRSTGQIYAAKLQEKKFLVKSKQINNTLNEKRLLESFNFPFAVNMAFFFMDNIYVYFIMPLLEGGDMFNLLRKKGKFDEHLARFYAAQVLLALEYLHYLDLLYRDLKPENILLDAEGYLRVADFGFCKQVKDRTYTFCGTPEYIAPEVILSKGYGKTADFWSYGILLYEFNSGSTPFYADDPMRIYEKVVDGKYLVKSYFSSELKDLVRNLVQNDITRRFGNLRRGIEDIKDHKWFKKIIWLALFNKAIRPPFVPPSKGYFENFKEEPLQRSSKDPYKDLFADF